mmetsp:Transcript_69044/g.130157  ORF Transcript_69044/g.130157 Transcript_69044/m.130157 type:complete len:235 (-) Transcript_69044:256-960(-)
MFQLTLPSSLTMLEFSILASSLVKQQGEDLELLLTGSKLSLTLFKITLHGIICMLMLGPLLLFTLTEICELLHQFALHGGHFTFKVGAKLRDRLLHGYVIGNFVLVAFTTQLHYLLVQPASLQVMLLQQIINFCTMFISYLITLVCGLWSFTLGSLTILRWRVLALRAACPQYGLLIATLQTVRYMLQLFQLLGHVHDNLLTCRCAALRACVTEIQLLEHALIQDLQFSAQLIA